MGENHKENVSRYLHENYYPPSSLWCRKLWRIVLTEVFHFSLIYLSRLFCLLNPNREGSQGTKAVKRRGRHQAKSPLCVCGCWWARQRGYGEGFLRGSSLLWMGQLFSAHSHVPVPAEQPCSAKKKDRHSLTTAHTVTKPAFMRGSIQRWPTGSRITGETICSNQGRASASASVFLLRT